MRCFFGHKLFFFKPLVRRHSLIALATLIFAVLSPAYADMRIIESNTGKYAIGAVVPNDTKFELGPGCFVKVLLLTSNETMLFEGRKARALPGGGTRGKQPPAPC
jgi:hypothetical protein